MMKMRSRKGKTGLRKIISITIVTNQGTSTTSLGDMIYGREVAEIKDISVEHENASTDFMFRATGLDNEVLKEIINCPVDITYY